MSKTLGKVALVVGAVALVATGAGAVAGALGAKALLGVSVATLSTVGTLAGVAAGVLTIGANLTAKKPSAVVSGSQTSFSADPDASIPLVLGRTGTAGNIVFRTGFDTADAGTNDRQAFVSVLSLGPVAAIEGQTVDRSPVSYLNGAAVGAFAGFMWSMTQVGALSGPALAFGAGAGTPPGWTASHKLSGLAAASWTLRFDTKAKLYQGGVPAPMWTVRGALCYDPRKDATYPGGSGPHRMADPADRAAYDAAVATWEWTENPYLLGLRWAHGVWQRDTSDASSTWTRIMGMGAPAAAIDTAAFVEGANIADANGWTCGGVVYSADDKWDTLKKILQAGMGEPLPLGARVSCFVNAPKVSLATITAADLRGDASVTATQPRRDRINSVTPRFRTEANGWKLLPAAPITVAAHVAADKGKRSKAIDYALIQDADQAGTAARYDIENAREFGPIVLPLGLAWMGYKPGDCVTVTVPEMGLNGQPVLLLNRGLEPATGIVTLTGRSETFGKHAFALGQTATPPNTPGLTGPALIPTPGAGAWTLSALAGSTPGLVITGASDAGTADAVVFEARRFVNGQAANANWTGFGVEAASITRKEIAPLAPLTQYEVAVSYRVREFTGPRRIIGPITTGALPEVVDQTARDAAGDALDIANGIAGTATEAQTKANTAITRINTLGDDGVLSGPDKKQLKTDDAALSAAWVFLDERADFVGEPVAVERAMASGARGAWVALRDGLDPPWHDTTQPTTVTQPGFRNTLTAYEQAITELADALRAAAAADARNALQEVIKAASDGFLTPAEKDRYEILFDGLVKRLNELVVRCNDYEITTAYPARDAAAAAIYQGVPGSLGTWLYASNGADVGDKSDTVEIDAATNKARWAAAYQKLAEFEGALIAVVPTEVREAIDDIEAITSDGKWAPSEKRDILIPRDAQLEATWTLLRNKADAIINPPAVLVSARANVVATRVNWQAHRNAYSPAWDDTTQVTENVNIAAAFQLLREFEIALVALADGLRLYTDGRAQTALDRVAVYDNDGILQKGEKWKLVREWQDLNDDHNASNMRYAALGYPADITPFYEAARDRIADLGTYLASFSQGGQYSAWDVASGDTPFPGGQPVNLPTWRAATKAQAEYRASTTGRQGPKGDPGDPGGGTRQPETQQISGGLTAGYLSPGITVAMTVGQQIPVLFELHGAAVDPGGANVHMFVQVFRANDGVFTGVNIGPESTFFTSGTEQEPGSGSGALSGTFTNNTGVAQSFIFRAHLGAGTGNITVGPGSGFLRV